MKTETNKLSFSCDYLEGAHANIIQRISDTNMKKNAGYGLDSISESAKDKIRTACSCPEAEIHFLVGGTQTNATVIDALLHRYQGVIAPSTGHISVHEAGAIEFGGHKVLTLPHNLGKITAEQIRSYLEAYDNDRNHDHMVMPGMVYLSHPTEYGTLYSLKELQEISHICHKHHLPLYLDGARLAYALASPQNDVGLKDLAELCDVFYIGGTKCGALCGEAVVIPKPDTIPHFFMIIKQHGALLAKGRLLGIQFDELFTDGLYYSIGESAVRYAKDIQDTLKNNGLELLFESPTNQVFCIISNHKMQYLSEKVEFGFWEKYDETHTIIRFATSWATSKEDVQMLMKMISV